MVTGLEFGHICNADLCNIQNPNEWNMSVDKMAYDKFLSEEIIYQKYKDKSNSELICDYLVNIINKTYEKDNQLYS